MAGNIKQAAATLSMECSYLNKMLTMKDIRLPGPDSRIVIFGQEVFKLKYKLSSINLDEFENSYNKGLQEDIKELTTAVLNQVSNGEVLTPVRTDLVVVFPATVPWDRVNRLEFSYSDRMLIPSPNMIFMLLYVPKSLSSLSLPSGSILGKRERDTETEPELQDVEIAAALQLSNKIEYSPNKKMKWQSSEESISEGEAVSTTADTPKEFACWQSHTLEPDIGRKRMREKQGKVHLHNAHPPASIFQKVLGAVKYLIGW